VNSLHIPRLMTLLATLEILAETAREYTDGQIADPFIGCINPHMHIHSVDPRSELVDHLLYLKETQPEFKYSHCTFRIERCERTGEHPWTWFKLICVPDDVKYIEAEVTLYCTGVAPERCSFWKTSQVWRDLHQWVSQLDDDENDNWAEIAAEQGNLGGVEWEETYAHYFAA
jgi:hypothetical protein